MKWYQDAIKKILNGIILFLVPLVLFLFVFKKAIGIVKLIILPIKRHLPAERILGIGMLSLVSIILILLFCYLTGLLIQLRKVKSVMTKLEDNVLIFIPGYSMLKAQTNDMISETQDKWQPVFVEHNGDWKMGIEVERQTDGYSTVYFPQPPDAKQGELRVVHESKLKKMDIPVGKFVKMMRGYGEGAASLLSKAKQ